MNRNELIADIASRTEQSKKDVATFMDAYEAAIVNAISNGDSVSLYGFMKIERREKKNMLGMDLEQKIGKLFQHMIL